MNSSNKNLVYKYPDSNIITTNKRVLVIIDVEGFTVSYSKNKSEYSYIITELSYIILSEDGNILTGASYRIKYDIRNVYHLNIKTIKYITKYYPNTLRGKLFCNSNNSISPSDARSTIDKLRDIDGNQLPLYAKGNFLESIWLNYPNSCDGNTQKLDRPIKRIGEIENYVIAYDKIENKEVYIRQNIKYIPRSKVSDKFLVDIKQNTQIDTCQHYSLYECIVFACMLANK